MQGVCIASYFLDTLLLLLFYVEHGMYKSVEPCTEWCTGHSLIAVVDIHELAIHAHVGLKTLTALSNTS